MNFACLRPIHDRLAADPRIECWYTATEGDVPPGELYGCFGITERIVPQRRAEWLKVDLYLNSDFARMARLRRRAPHVHFFHGVAGKYDLDGTTTPVRDMSHFDHLARFDRIAFINEDRHRKWRAVGLLSPDDPRPVLVGRLVPPRLRRRRHHRAPVDRSPGDREAPRPRLRPARALLRRRRLGRSPAPLRRRPRRPDRHGSRCDAAAGRRRPHGLGLLVGRLRVPPCRPPAGAPRPARAPGSRPRPPRPGALAARGGRARASSAPMPRTGTDR